MKKAGMEAIKIKSRSDLEKIRKQTNARLDGRTRIVVGLGTCGQAAGPSRYLTPFSAKLRRWI